MVERLQAAGQCNVATRSQLGRGSSSWAAERGRPGLRRTAAHRCRLQD